jgi:hypothetical protein
MQNKLSDLNNHLFAQLERLGDEEIAGDQLDEEINRAKAVTDVAQQVIANANLALKAQALMYEYGIINAKSEDGKKMPSQLRQFFIEE